MNNLQLTSVQADSLQEALNRPAVPVMAKRLPPRVRRVLHGDWGWFLETKNKDVFKFIRYTWRHRIRLWIGINGNMGGGEYIFKRVKFRGRLHNFLNRML